MQHLRGGLAPLSVPIINQPRDHPSPYMEIWIRLIVRQNPFYVICFK